ncbi:MAG: hypothetical protein ACKO0Z_29020 [Betaproteobacteria bacterium]
MSTTVMDLLQRKLQEQEDSHVQALVGGAVHDYAAYRELCGVIRGLQTAQREIADLVRKLKDDDND